MTTDFECSLCGDVACSLEPDETASEVCESCGHPGHLAEVDEDTYDDTIVWLASERNCGECVACLRASLDEVTAERDTLAGALRQIRAIANRPNSAKRDDDDDRQLHDDT